MVREKSVRGATYMSGRPKGRVEFGGLRWGCEKGLGEGGVGGGGGGGVGVARGREGVPWDCKGDSPR